MLYSNSAIKYRLSHNKRRILNELEPTNELETQQNEIQIQTIYPITVNVSRGDKCGCIEYCQTNAFVISDRLLWQASCFPCELLIFRVVHECIYSKTKDATPNWKNIEIYFENFSTYKWVNLHFFNACVQKSVYAAA